MTRLTAGLVAGSVLGVIVFGGLRLTATRLTGARFPALVLVGSAIARLGVVTVALVALARFDPMALVSAVAGMMLVRTVFVQLARHGGG